MRVAAIVINWNGADHLAGCLDALLAQDHEDFEIVVIDNASTDGSRDILAEYSDRCPIRVVYSTFNRGYAGAANVGLQDTDAPGLLLCNPDIRPAPDYVGNAVAALEQDPRRGAVQGKLLRMDPAPDGSPVIDTTGHVAFRTRLFRNRGEGEIDRGQWDEPGEVFGVSGALALYRRTMLEDIALVVDGRPEVFDEDLFAFWEDVDVDWRAARRGWQCWYAPTAVAHHERGGAGPRRTARVEQLNYQNRLLVVLKNDHLPSLVMALPGVMLTTVLKTVELLLTVPSAFLRSLFSPLLIPRMLHKRRQIAGRADVRGGAVVRRWFVRFDYVDWVNTWWRRVRGIPPGA